MCSNGGVATPKTVSEKPVNTLLSGPAAGILGGAWAGSLSNREKLITFDVGGTSADIGIITGSGYSESSARDTWIAGYPVMVPMIDIHTIGAGGGSIAHIDEGGAFKVGPRSAGSRPGPACYGHGGLKPTVSDANVVLGRIDEHNFLGGEMQIYTNAAYKVIDELSVQLGLSREKTAEGVLQIMNNNMANAIREKTIQKEVKQAVKDLEEVPHPKEAAVKTPQEKVVQKEVSPERITALKATPSESVKQSKIMDEAIQKEALQEGTSSEEDRQTQLPPEEPTRIEHTPDKSATIPPWLKEPAQVEKYLEYLQQDHSAYATLLSIGNTPWTYSEQLTEEQAHGIVKILSEHDEGLQSKGALIRYIRLGGAGSDYLLYATPVIGDINLSMIYNLDTPFNVARRQTHKLSRLLKEEDPRKLVIKEEKPIIEKLISVSQEEDKPLLPSDWIPAPDVKAEAKEPVIVSASPPPMEEPERKSVKEPSVTTVPGTSTIPNDWLPKQPKPAAHLPFLDQITTQSKTIREMEPINLIQQEPRYYLPFTAILLPRFPNHRLAGSLAIQLETWLKELCVAWGWRVDNVEIRSEFLRFTFSLSPDIAPAQAVQNLANNLSSRILNAFPGFMKDLPAGQFWTKSYLLTAGSDVGKDRLASFIESTRQEQGLVK